MQNSAWRAGWAVLLVISQLPAAEHRGVVRFAGLPLPGATVTATQGTQKLTAITDANGAYLFENLVEGSWTLEAAMQLFAPVRQTIVIPSGNTPTEWNLDLLAAPERQALIAKAPPRSAAPAPVAATVTQPTQPKPATPPPAEPTELAQRAADGLLINGSVNNGAASAFSQFPAFGNNRRGPRSQYNGNLGLVANNAVFDARNYSLTGLNTPKPAYSRLQGLASFGGPIRIPGWIERNGPVLTINYQWTRNRTATTATGLLPTAAQREGDLAATDPTTNQPFPNNRIPASRQSPQALALLSLYPRANSPLAAGYNFQTPLVRGLHQDDLQSRITKQVNRTNNLAGSFAWQSTRTDTPSLLGFLETGAVRGLNGAINWRHTFPARVFTTTGLEYSSLATRVTPFFANRTNISGLAGITGNEQSPSNWGPPALSFASGIAPLGESQSARNRNQTLGLTSGTYINRGRHNLQFGGSLRWLEFNIVSQQDARGAFAFTGKSTGNDFASFLLGLPDTSSIAYGNADKYLRGRTADAFLNDDFRVNPSLTLNFGLRYEYSSPVTEKYSRLINLALAPNFLTARPVQGATPQPDRNNLSPRLAVAWKPLPASSLLVRAGYGIYYDTSIYSPLAREMAQQAPLSRNLRIENSPATPLTLAQGFPALASAPTFAIDPNFRVGYSQSWLLSLQRDLPFALQITATYNGSKGTRAQQRILPNTYPTGALNPCADCPTGFTYLTSNGNSTRHSGQLQLRRRLRSGLAGQLQYTWAKALDNTALGGRGQGGLLIAQNWLDLRAERGRSNFDQRHAVQAQLQYTSGMGLKGQQTPKWLRDWTLTGQTNAGTGLPQSPIYFAPVRGTGVTGSLRPDLTGVPVTPTPNGLALNPAAFAAPAPGRWGNAARNSLPGPGQLVVNASLSRTFRSNDKISMDFRIDANNLLNTVTYAAWNSIVGNPQFGLPVAANPMRTLQTAFRVRF